MGMDPSNNTEVSNTDLKPSSKRPKFSSSGGIGDPTNSSGSGGDSTPVNTTSESETNSKPTANTTANPASNTPANTTSESNSNPASNPVSPDTVPSVTISSIKPIAGVSHTTQKLDSVFDRQIAKLSGELSALNLKLSETTDESKIQSIRDTIDSTHDQLAFVQEAKLDTIRKIQRASSSNIGPNLTDSPSNSSKRSRE